MWCWFKFTEYLFSYILIILCTYPLKPSITAVLIPAALAVNRKWSAKKPICRNTQLGTGLYSGRAYKYFSYGVKKLRKEKTLIRRKSLNNFFNLSIPTYHAKSPKNCQCYPQNWPDYVFHPSWETSGLDLISKMRFYYSFSSLLKVYQ